jgi:hypothetical protein
VLLEIQAENALKLAYVIDEQDALRAKLEGLKEAEADAQALRALAAWLATRKDELGHVRDMGVSRLGGFMASLVWVDDQGNETAYAGRGATLASAIMDALEKVGK